MKLSLYSFQAGEQAHFATARERYKTSPFNEVQSRGLFGDNPKSLIDQVYRTHSKAKE